MMNRRIFSILGLIILSLLLFGAGLWVGQARLFNTNWQSGSMMGNTNVTGMIHPGMMGGQFGDMMNDSGMMGMMGSTNGQHMPHMMNGQADNMMGMMSGFSGLSDVDPLTIDEVKTAVTNYLSTLNQDNLTLGEIMIFTNHAYAQILDSDTGQGAFEVLIDPATGNVFSEPGPNMMWNTEYGIMGGSSMMNGQYGSMMGHSRITADTEISVTAEDAPNLAQTYLDKVLPGTTADDHADTFPGYYTLHIEREGEAIGMLSVNAYTGDVFLHNWHGDLIEMAGP